MNPVFEPLTPTSFLERVSKVFAERVAVIDGDRSFSYADLGLRVGCLAGALCDMGFSEKARVAVMLPNTHAMIEATLAVPAAGMVLVALNTRLASAELAEIIEDSGAELLIFDSEFDSTVGDVCARLDRSLRTLRIDSKEDGVYEELLTSSRVITPVANAEDDLLALNYTSGTTGRPKGAMYHHRGAYLQALAMAVHCRLGPDSTYLWTLPMFHCNGWCFPWAVTAVGGTHVCLRKVEPRRIWQLVRQHRVSHACAAPTVLNDLVNHPAAMEGPELDRPFSISTGGSPPAPALLERAAVVRVEIQHLYGLTETFGPSVVCDWWPEWNALSPEEAARQKARQGVSTVLASRLRVVDDRGQEVAADGASVGELQVKGNNLMLGYYGDPAATDAAFAEGRWLRTGDLAVVHSDHYLEVRDRAKDVIISGGENIASVEVEQALAAHSAVLECAVVGVADERWGEVPVAYVALRKGANATEEELREHVRERLARFKAPKRVIFVDELPKTATGKIRKFQLRDEVKSSS